MKLLTKALEKKFPKLYANEHKESKDIKIIAKFFCPWNQWTWFATEYDGEDTFFGYVMGYDYELGYFSLSELSSIRGFGGLGIERDLHFEECSLEDVMRTDVY